jgi:NAD-dependent deacetylase
MTPPTIAILTGAGVSAASGVPTFRDAGGLWRQHRMQDLATPQAFRRDPRLVWEFYDWRRQRLAACAPNPAHRVLAEMEAALPGFMLATQNVDGLHLRAGSRRVLTLHGDIWQVRCTSCEYADENRQVPLAPLPPPCPRCGALLRPGVVWFGEALDGMTLSQAMRAFAEADIALVAGTSALVYPAADLPLQTLRRGGVIHEFNTERTPLSELAAEVHLGPCEITLPQWWAEFRQNTVM